MSESYNGWANLETWLTVKWMQDNEAGNSAFYRRMAANCVDETVENYPVAGERATIKRVATSKLANRLQSNLKNRNPLQDDTSLFGDLMSASLHEVDWHGIASGYVANIVGEED